MAKARAASLAGVKIECQSCGAKRSPFSIPVCERATLGGAMATGDSEGTLGGLVAQAQPGRFERLVEEALRRSVWCSNDPVCMESPGEGALSSNLAACHGCVLLPETSCEEGNRLLDRGLLVGTIDDASLGFFYGAPIT